MTLAAQCLAEVQRYCNTYFSATTLTEDIDGGHVDLITKFRPIISVTSITDVYDSSTVDSDDYVVENNSGLIRLSIHSSIWTYICKGWPRGRKRFRVVYQTGYSSVPADVQLAIDTLVSIRTNRPDASIASQTIGDYSVSYAAGSGNSMPADVARLLAPYVTRAV
jgi:hypothetical protein